MAKTYDLLFKIFLIGDHVGKSAVLDRYAEDYFQSGFISRIGEYSRKPDPTNPSADRFQYLIRAGVGWVWLARLDR